MKLRLHAASALIGSLIAWPLAHAASTPGVELSEVELSGAFAAGLDLDIEGKLRPHDSTLPYHGSLRDRDEGTSSYADRTRDLARSVEDQLPWSQKQVAGAAVQATVRATQAMATITQMLPFGLVFLPTIGLPLVPQLPSKQSSGQH
ncbi:hypothetical protein [Aquabacterium sp.]|uniref:hypothetical protein n=1 Tax=Aquabacterium sp. TaxID=1872578 RepID=UPI0035B1E8B9